MSGGNISSNHASSIYGSLGLGGGVCVWNGTFTMSDEAIISENTASLNGGGVATLATFIMNGGTISDNTSSNGGGVYVNGPYSNFTMSGGATISSNTASRGGGVSVDDSGTFNMSAGDISNNKAIGISTYGGGGVFVTGSEASFEISGGYIYGNTSATYGGGVHVSSGTFIKTSGTGVIPGIDAMTLPRDRNTAAATNGGNAVYVTNTVKRETSVLPGQALKWENSTATGDWTD